MKINYVSEFEAFMRFAKNEGLSGNERLLWTALFYIANDRAAFNPQTEEYDWPEDYIFVSNNEVNLHSTLDKRGIATVRNTLKQRGLIDFKPGEKNKRNPAYRLLYLTAGRKGAKGDVGYKFVPNNDPSNAPNDVPNGAPNNDPNNVSKVTPLPINIDIDTDIAAETDFGAPKKNAYTNDISKEYYNCAGTREYLSPTDNRYLNQYLRRTVEGYRDALGLPNDNWRYSTRARAATAQHVLDRILKNGRFWTRDARNTDGLYDLILQVLEERQISPLSIYIIAIRSATKDRFLGDLTALRAGYYEFGAEEAQEG